MVAYEFPEILFFTQKLKVGHRQQMLSFVILGAGDSCLYDTCRQLLQKEPVNPQLLQHTDLHLEKALLCQKQLQHELSSSDSVMLNTEQQRRHQ